jgi:tetratricopeptide (TPR) repeat protein
MRLMHHVSSGSLEKARAEVDSLMKLEKQIAANRIVVLGLSGDIAWLAGDTARAQVDYSEALDLAAEDASIRMLAIKIWATSHPGPGRGVRDYLLGSASGDLRKGLALLEDLALRYPDEPEVSYLLGRAQYLAGQWREAAQSLERAAEGPLGGSVVQAEAIRLLAASLVWEGDRQGALSAIKRLEAMPPPTPALRFQAGEWRALAEAME